MPEQNALSPSPVRQIARTAGSPSAAASASRSSPISEKVSALRCAGRSSTSQRAAFRSSLRRDAIGFTVPGRAAAVKAVLLRGEGAERLQIEHEAEPRIALQHLAAAHQHEALDLHRGALARRLEQQ